MQDPEVDRRYFVGLRQVVLDAHRRAVRARIRRRVATVLYVAAASVALALVMYWLAGPPAGIPW